MQPTATLYNLPPIGMSSMGEDASPPREPLGQRPSFVLIAIVVAVLLLAMAGRYGWKRWRG